MKTDHLLIELGTEELPPTALKRLSESFAQGVLAGLTDAELIANTDDHEVFASPRRLALLVASVANGQPDQTIERRGPAVNAAFDAEGNPSPAARGFAQSCGVEVDQLQRLKTDKGEWLSYSVNQEGKSLADLIGPILELALKKLPIPKRMRWGDGDAEFVRPAHWLVVMHGADIVPTQVLSLTAGNITHGHRFHCSEAIELTNASDYKQVMLNRGTVTASFAERQSIIQEQIGNLASSLNATIDADQDLLDEVTALVEKPVALLGEFDPAFLQVPSECLISAMRDHQKYFHLRDQSGELLPNFITVSNIQSKNPQRVVAGNERVLRARLSDAQFFWDTDRKHSLAAQLPRLDDVLFHAKLGSVGQKKRRLQSLAKTIASQIGADPEICERAAELCKADLLTDMVGEFDKLQGIMGRYYADLDGEPALVGTSIEQHYWPRYAGDRLPESPEAQTLSLADRLDSLVGIYSAGEVPTGDKDPYSLRRTALGILRILIEHQRPLSLVSLVAASSEAFAEQDVTVSADTQSEIVNFIESRLTAYYQAQGVATNAINAVAACTPHQPLDFHYRLQAVDSFNELDEAPDLAAANKRIGNILKKQADGMASAVDEALFAEPAEEQLYAALLRAENDAIALFDQGEYSDGLKALAALRTPVDAFFDSVMVMSDDPQQQANRLALLHRLQALFLRVADIGQLQT